MLSAEKIRLAVTSRLHKDAPQFQIVPDKAIRLFEHTAEKFSQDLAKIDGFWEKVAFLKDRVLARTTKSLRGNIARLYAEYTAAMLRGEMASWDDDARLQRVDPRIEERVQYDAYVDSIASLP
jgi:hypothetical protein